MENILDELYQVAESMRNGPFLKFVPWSFEEAKTAINKQGASGLFDQWPKMQNFLDDLIVRDWLRMKFVNYIME